MAGKNKFQLDVVIPVWSNYEILPLVFSSLKEGLGDISYKIYCTDDASPDYDEIGRKFWEEAKQKNNLELIVHRQNTGYGKSVNDAVNAGKSEYVLIMNSDVLMTKDSGLFLYSHIVNNDDVGMVFPKSLFLPNSNNPNKPAGKIQHAGMAFDFEGNPYHLFLGWSSNHPFVNVIRDFNICSGVCILVRRNLWRALGGYDLNYGLGYFEDIDFCMRLRLETKKNIRYLPMSVIYHGTSTSFEKREKLEKKRYNITKNALYFREKFGGMIPYDEFLLTMPN